MREVQVTKHARARARTRLGVEPSAAWWNRVARQCWWMPAESTVEGVSGWFSACRYTISCTSEDGVDVDIAIVIDWAVPQIQTLWVRAVGGVPEDGSWERAAEYVESAWRRAAGNK